MSKFIFIFFSFILLIYLLIPGPSSIDNFQPLPNSSKSTLEGDTIQVPNIAAYFSDNYRDFVTGYYRDNYKSQVLIPFLPLRLNYPPEYAYNFILDQTRSTYLEEYVYPLRNSLFVNGYEPFYENGKPKFWDSVKADEKNGKYYTKVTLRFYPSSLWVRLVIWFFIVSSIFLIWKMTRRIISRG
jgi:hypothetical protein